MRVRLVVREVTLDEVAQMPDGSAEPIGQPLRSFLTQMQAKAGWVDVPLPEGPLAHVGRPLTTASPEIEYDSDLLESGVDYRIISPHIVQVSLTRWVRRDPDTTRLSIGWKFDLTDEGQRPARP